MQPSKVVKRPKSKVEIMADVAKKKEEERQRAFVRNYLYPFLLQHSKSINDAKALCATAVVALQTAYQNKMFEHQKAMSSQKVPELDLKGAITDPEKYQRELDFIALFDNETVANTESLLRGMREAIESFEREESTKRSLSELPATLL